MADAIHVSIDEVRALGGVLRAVKGDLGDLGGDFGLYDGVLGAHPVKEKLSEVAGNWSKTRTRIGGELERLAAMAVAAAAADGYAEVESDQSRSFSGPVGDG